MPKPHLDEDVARQPHDGLVRRIFTKPEAAAAELRLALPPGLVARLDWDTLRVEPGTFVDRELRQRSSDILYSIRFRGRSRRVLVYALLEHQSSLDRLMALRFLVYAGRIWERWLREHDAEEPVPLLMPLLLYQGPRGWTMPRRLTELHELSVELAGEIVPPIELTFTVDELEHRVDQVASLPLQRGATLAEVARTLLWLASHPSHRWGERLARLGRLLDEIGQSWGPAELRTLLTYVVSVFGTRAPELRAILDGFSHEEARHMYTGMIQELIDQGRVVGAHDGRVAALLVVLDSRGLTPTDEVRARLSACTDDDQLEAWLRRAATAASVDEVFEH